MVTSFGNSGRRNVLSYYLNANAPAGLGVQTKHRPVGASNSLGPYVVRHVNPAGQESREFLQLH